MKRRHMILTTVALGACNGLSVPITTKKRPTPSPFDAPSFDVLTVQDVRQTDLAGTVLYDEVIPFDAGTVTPGSPSTGIPSSGGRIKGAVQSRVVKSSTTQTLIFAFRFRDLQFEPGTGPQNKGSQLIKIEIAALYGFPKSAYPVEMYSLAPSQSLGVQTLPGLSNGGGRFEWAADVTEPEGTTFFEILTQATAFKTGKYFSFEVDARGNNGGQTTVVIDRFAVPA